MEEQDTIIYDIDKVNDFLEWGKYGYHPEGEFEVLNMFKNIDAPEGYVSPRVQINCYMNRFLFEFDDIPISQQLEIMNKLIQYNILYRATYSGSKSIHMILVVEQEPQNIDEYKFLWQFLNKQLDLRGADKHCSDNSRLTRRPNIMRQYTKEQLVGNEHVIEAYKLLNMKIDIEKFQVEQKLLAIPKNVIKFDWRPAYEDEKRKIELEIEARRLEYERNKDKYGSENMNPEKFLERYIQKHDIIFMDGFKHVAASSIASAYFKAGFTDVEYVQNWVKNNCMSDDKTIWCNLGKLK